MLNINKKWLCLIAVIAAAGCNFQQGLSNFLDGTGSTRAENGPAYSGRIKMPNSVVVCRSKQCAPSKLSMSREYIYNSLLHLFDNNNHKTALLCAANPGSHTCTENYITMPIQVGMTPAYAYIDSVKITDVSVANANQQINLILNYNLTYNGQTPDCTPAKSIMFVKNVNNIILEDGGYNCKMTTIGKTTVKTLFAIDYIDLDYGFIGGYYSVGLSGPAYGGGSGYMMIRLPKDAYPLSPKLTAPKQTTAIKSEMQSILNPGTSQTAELQEEINVNTDVQIFPIKR